MQQVSPSRFVLVHALIAGLLSLAFPSFSRGSPMPAPAPSASPVATPSEWWHGDSTVDPSFPTSTVTSHEAAAPQPASDEVTLVLWSGPVPERWQPAGASLSLASIHPGERGDLRISSTLQVAAVAIINPERAGFRFGYGLQSEVSIDLSSDAPQVHKSTEFMLVDETPSASAAIAAADALLLKMAVDAASLRTAWTQSAFSTCFKTCVALAHGPAFTALLICIGAATFAEAAVVAACALACLLTGPGWVACVAACLATVATATGIALATVLGACFAAYVARMNLALALCAIGCIW